MRLRLRVAFTAASNGKADRSTPIRVMSVKPSKRPPISNVRPDATNAWPRVVSTPRIRVPACFAVSVTVLGLPWSDAVQCAEDGMGTRSTISWMTSAQVRRATWVSPEGITRWARTGSTSA